MVPQGLATLVLAPCSSTAVRGFDESGPVSTLSLVLFTTAMRPWRMLSRKAKLLQPSWIRMMKWNMNKQ